MDLSPEKPTLLLEVIDFYRRELNYSLSDLATALAATEADLMGFLYGLGSDAGRSGRD